MGSWQGCIRVGGWVGGWVGACAPCLVLHISCPILLHASLKENAARMVMWFCCNYKSQLTTCSIWLLQNICCSLASCRLLLVVDCCLLIFILAVCICWMQLTARCVVLLHRACCVLVFVTVCLPLHTAVVFLCRGSTAVVFGPEYAAGSPSRFATGALGSAVQRCTHSTRCWACLVSRMCESPKMVLTGGLGRGGTILLF